MTSSVVAAGHPTAVNKNWQDVPVKTNYRLICDLGIVSTGSNPGNGC